MLKSFIHKVIILLYQSTMLGLSKGPHITRYFMYQHLSQYSGLRPEGQKVLSISNSEKIAKILGFNDNQIVNASYPEFNVLNLPFSDGEFDAVVSDQVLEHVEGNPQTAMDELFRVLKPGGISLHTTCFVNPIHGAPSDYWRFSPEALKLMTKQHGTVLDCGGWGNLFVWPFIFLGLRFQPIPNAPWHPVHWIAIKNQRLWPIVTWVLSKKNG